MKQIELNEQQIDFLKIFLQERILEGLDDEEYSQTSQMIAQQIINKLEE